MHGGNSAGAEFVYKVQSPFNRPFGRVFVYAFFKAFRRIARLAEHSRRTPYVIAFEFGAFEQDGFGIRFDFAVKSAHYTGQRDSFFAVANKQVIVGKFDFFFVESHYLFAVFRPSYVDFVSRKVFKVESVHRLPEFEKHVIRYVNDIVYGIKPAKVKSSRHPLRRFFYFNILYEMRDVSRTKFAVVNFHLDVFVAFYRRDRIVVRRFFERFAERARDFSRDAEHALTVRTVCKYRNIEDVISEVKQISHFFAERKLVVKNEYAVAGRAVVYVVVYAEFFAAAEHSVRRLSAKFTVENTVARGESRSVYRDGNDIADFDVDGVRYYLQYAVFAGVYLTNAQSFGVGVPGYLFYPAGYDFIEFVAVRYNLLHFETAVEESFFEFFGRYVYIYEFFKPT